MGFYKHNCLQSKFDQASRIYKSVFVSDFPEGFTPKDLWKVCNDYGTVVDVFIPNKKSKAGKRFAFVRFIKVINLDRLIENLNTIWIGRFYLFANPVRFEKPKKFVFLTYKDMHAAPSNSTGFMQPKAQDHAGSYVNAVNGSSTVAVPVKDVNSIPNLRTLLMDEGFSDVKLKYLGGMWVMFEFDKVDTKGETLDIENNVDSSFGRKRLCIKAKQPVSILESFKIIFKGKVLLVRAKEVFTCNSTFLAHKEMVYASEEESVHSPKKIPAHSLFCEEVSGDDSESDVEEVYETIFGDNSSSPNNNSDAIGGETREEVYQDINRESVDPNVVKEGGSVLGVLEDMIR
nr:hypothetical protein [Tanacetum cinerariifolium]